MRFFIMFLGVISLILDYYIFQGVKTLIAGWKNKKLKKIFYWLYWLFFVGFNLCFSWAVYRRFTHDENTAFLRLVMNAFLIFFVTKLVIIVFLLAEDLGRGLVLAYRMLKRKSSDNWKNPYLLPGRRKFITQLALGLAALPFTAFVYGVAKGKYRFTLHRKTLFFEDLPMAFEGFTITQFSDFHAGSFDDMAAVQAGMNMVQAQKSDLVVFTGDLVNNFAHEAEPYLEMFQNLKAPFGKYSILGNHDYGMYHKWPSEVAEAENLAKLKDLQAAMGLKLLLDENVSIKKNGQEISLLGVENWGKGFIQLGNLDKAMANVKTDAFKILLSHDPSHWEEVVKKHPARVHLTLSGHTHGMQFGVETPDFKWSPAQYRYKTWAGIAQENGRRLYVNRGFGFIGFSGRVGIWPEVTVFELRRGKPENS